MEDMARASTWPTSLRLVDNIQFQFGQALKPAEPSMWKRFMDEVKKFALVKVKGFHEEELCAATTLYEGTKDSVAR